MKRLVLLLMLFIAVGAKAQIDEGRYLIKAYSMSYEGKMVGYEEPLNDPKFWVNYGENLLVVTIANYQALAYTILNEAPGGEGYVVYNANDIFTGTVTLVTAKKENGDVILTIKRAKGRYDVFVLTKSDY